MSFVATAVVGIGAGAAIGGIGAAVGANQASKDRAGARGVANMPGLDVGSAVGEAGKLAPQTRELEAQRNAFNRAQLLESLGLQIPGYQEGQAQRTQNAMSLLRGELPPDLAAQIQRNTASKALTGGYAGSQAARNLTARDLGRTSLDLQQAGAQQFSNILGTTPLSPLANYEFTPQMIANLRAEERAKKQAALLGSYNMPSAGGVGSQYLGSLGSGLTSVGFGALGQMGGAASPGSSGLVQTQQSIMPKTI
tara:strand:- start:2166 stop:2921 length:756 start_codon:yes stop_codon:yes gene_type:complete